jgi:hypothetical protein
MTLCLLPLMICVLLPASAISEEEDGFFDPVGLSYTELEEVWQDVQPPPLSEEYAFTEHLLTERIDSATGFCVTDEAIFICDMHNDRIHVYNKQFEKIHTIRGGAQDRFSFAPRGITALPDGRVLVITDTFTTDTGYLMSYDADFEPLEDIPFHMPNPPAYNIMEDVVLLDNGEIYLTAYCDEPELGKIYRLQSDGSVTGAGYGLFGKLAPSVNGDQVVFVNTSFAMDPNALRRNESMYAGQSALYQLNGGAVMRVQKLPAILRIPITDDEKAELLTLYRAYGEETDTLNWDTYTYDIFAHMGYTDIARFGGEYYVLAGHLPAVLVFDEDFSFRRVIPVTVRDEWSQTQGYERYMSGAEWSMVEALYLDFDSEGTLYVLAKVVKSGVVSTDFILLTGEKLP